MPLEVFFGASSQVPMTVREERVAKAVCAGCPVRAECLELALLINANRGVFGGLTRPERKRAWSTYGTVEKVLTAFRAGGLEQEVAVERGKKARRP